MAYNVSAITGYVEENRDLLIANTLMGAMTMKNVTLQTGVKGSEKLNYLDVQSPIQDGTNCGFDPQGDDTFTNRTIKTALMKVNKEWCWKKLIGTAMQHEVRIQAGLEQIPFEEKITGKITENINDQIEKMLWQGNTEGSTSTYLDLMDGYVKVIKAEGTNKTISGADIYEKVQNFYKQLPTYLLRRNEAVIAMSPANYREYVLALVNKNMYHYTEDIKPEMEVVIPGTTMKVIGVPGLDGVEDTIFAFEWKNLFAGTDLENASEVFDIFESKDNGTMRMDVEFNLGAQIAFPDQTFYAALGA